ncbi:MAG: aldolase/citrate lyase family protein [Planctomycetota bacterium]
MTASLFDRLKAGDVVLGFNVMFPAAGIIECVGRGWDWVWIDGQHGQHDYRSILECVRVADSLGLAPIVRVPGHDPGTIGRALDMKPAGIMVPMVNTAEDAREIVAAMRFPPLGARSFGGRRVCDLGGREYHRTVDAETALLAQIETPEGIANADEIASVPGVDVLFFGPDDVKVRLGIPIDASLADSSALSEALQAVGRAAADAGKFAGCPAGDRRSFELAVSLGYRLLVGGADVGFLRAAAAAKRKEFQEALTALRKEGSAAAPRRGQGC